MTAQIDILAPLIPRLPPRDHHFAHDLVRKGRKWGLSDKQAEWVGKLIDKANNHPPLPVERKVVDVGNFQGAIDLFRKAAEYLKHPKVRLQFQADASAPKQAIRLAVAGPKAKVPGSINVGTDAPYGEAVWFGRIHPDGRFEQATRPEVPEALVQLLKAFAERPAETAAEYGRLTGHCCFCDRHLQDARSTAVGYGPHCAKRWQLPW